MSRTFYGKYRGIVSDIQDPLMQGRIKARVPAVLGDDESGWALPCAPFGGSGVGFFALPTVGAGVWIEFENGDPDYPIWSGAWWGSTAEIPPDLLAPPYKKVMLKTEGGHSIVLDDTPGVGGITLKTSGGQKVAITATDVTIDNGMGASIVLQGPQITIKATSIQLDTGAGGSVKLTGPQVSVNDGALEVL
ncbi:hypothetical protein sce2095 [Sorangium cellulosum So ce56]|uniref:Gp5/Type VI secretion system Vgr protein OB-fold domain-containing protein n=1 Tax=Sorangium cellulosum (strain So ce56) TaxID=448385 RepID=A9FVA4_SORC5|nr:phage baseplate assembly protein V [Sorangium cellulosum]CAN92254.1 hypothetical protein sce2095 [Sorangium cellulosum So ce56]